MYHIADHVKNYNSKFTVNRMMVWFPLIEDKNDEAQFLEICKKTFSEDIEFTPHFWNILHA